MTEKSMKAIFNLYIGIKQPAVYCTKKALIGAATSSYRSPFVTEALIGADLWEIRKQFITHIHSSLLLTLWLW